VEENGEKRKQHSQKLNYCERKWEIDQLKH